MGGAIKSFIEKALPFAAMVFVECGEVGMITLGKAAMNVGLSSLVYVVYYNALGTVILLPGFIFHTCRFMGYNRHYHNFLGLFSMNVCSTLLSLIFFNVFAEIIDPLSRYRSFVKYLRLDS